jgi:hypothetical protein
MIKKVYLPFGNKDKLGYIPNCKNCEQGCI